MPVCQRQRQWIRTACAAARWQHKPQSWKLGASAAERQCASSCGACAHEFVLVPELRDVVTHRVLKKKKRTRVLFHTSRGVPQSFELALDVSTKNYPYSNPCMTPRRSFALFRKFETIARSSYPRVLHVQKQFIMSKGTAQRMLYLTPPLNEQVSFARSSSANANTRVSQTYADI